MKRLKCLITGLLLLLILSGCGGEVQETVSVFEPTPVVTQEAEPRSEKTKAEPAVIQKIVEEEPETDIGCTLYVHCKSVLSNMDKLKEGKADIIPKDAVIYPETSVVFEKGDSAFDVLQRELRNKGIHMEFVKTPAYDSVYIEGIANLYEFDCGDMSGWLYRVNGEKLNYGSSQYKVKDGDYIEFYYTCNYMVNNS